MDRLIFVASLLVAIPAVAEPVVHPPCAVTIAHAPEDVRAVIEHWVSLEPRCGVALEVRIVPTDGGLYLFARDDQGRVRERLVPDAQSAGVLVASWAADDAMPAPEPVAVAPPEQEVAPVLAPEPLPVQAPGMTEAPAVYIVRRPAPERWLTLDAGYGDQGGEGLRATMDVWAHGAWRIGLAASISSGNVPFDSESFGTVRDAKALAYASRLMSVGDWRLRLGFGAGLDLASVANLGSETFGSISGVLPVAQLAVTLAHTLGDHWGIEAGPVLSVFPFQLDHMDGGAYFRRTADLMVFAGVQRRL